MALWVCSGDHDMQSRIDPDSLGQLYLIFAAVWTVLSLISITFFLGNWKLPCLRVCRMPLRILAVYTLHVYWCICMLAYVLNGFFACSMEHWVMSTYLPVGIALYQASNTQHAHATRNYDTLRACSYRSLVPGCFACQTEKAFHVEVGVRSWVNGALITLRSKL
jgi:hypothetical protein